MAAAKGWTPFPQHTTQLPQHLSDMALLPPASSKPSSSSSPARSLVGCFTFSLSRIKPSRGRDIDHWFLQSSKMMMFSTVDSIWKKESEGLNPALPCQLSSSQHCAAQEQRFAFDASSVGALSTGGQDEDLEPPSKGADLSLKAHGGGAEGWQAIYSRGIVT